jgi:hypothetical protein
MSKLIPPNSNYYTTTKSLTTYAIITLLQSRIQIKQFQIRLLSKPIQHTHIHTYQLLSHSSVITTNYIPDN